MLRVGVIGFGGMGHGHARIYAQRPDCRLAAVADIREEMLRGKSMQINLGSQAAVDMSGVATFTSADEMLAKAKLDLVSVCLPTDLHAEYTIKALKAGCHVLCEKPMARTLTEADAMIAAQRASGKLLMIGLCLRFWPCYEKLVDVHRSGEFGALRLLSLRRLSPCPRWGYQNWYVNGKRSGGALLDMHIHDTDIVNHMLGVPRAVFTIGNTVETGAVDNAVTQYIYGDNVPIMAETTWSLQGSFSMSFLAVFEQATLQMGYRDENLYLDRAGVKQTEKVDLPPGGGHEREIAYFIECVKAGREPERCLPFSARETMRIAFAEEASALAGGKRIEL